MKIPYYIWFLLIFILNLLFCSDGFSQNFFSKINSRKNWSSLYSIPNTTTIKEKSIVKKYIDNKVIAIDSISIDSNNNRFFRYFFVIDNAKTKYLSVESYSENIADMATVCSGLENKDVLQVYSYHVSRNKDCTTFIRKEQNCNPKKNIDLSFDVYTKLIDYKDSIVVYYDFASPYNFSNKGKVKYEIFNLASFPLLINYDSTWVIKKKYKFNEYWYFRIL